MVLYGTPSKNHLISFDFLKKCTEPEFAFQAVEVSPNLAGFIHSAGGLAGRDESWGKITYRAGLNGYRCCNLMQIQKVILIYLTTRVK